MVGQGSFFSQMSLSLVSQHPMLYVMGVFSLGCLLGRFKSARSLPNTLGHGAICLIIGGTLSRLTLWSDLCAGLPPAAWQLCGLSWPVFWEAAWEAANLLGP